jgi:hypothetical protein
MLQGSKLSVFDVDQVLFDATWFLAFFFVANEVVLDVARF